MPRGASGPWTLVRFPVAPVRDRAEPAEPVLGARTWSVRHAWPHAAGNLEMRHTMPSMTDSSNRSQASSTAAFSIAKQDLDSHTSVVAVTGELDLSSAPNLKWTLVDLLDASRNRLVVDLSD